MPEYADMILDGTKCACGKHLGNGPGYPRYCSDQCRQDYDDVSAVDPNLGIKARTDYVIKKAARIRNRGRR